MMGTKITATIALALLFAAMETVAQISLLPYDSIRVKKNATKYLKNPWAGGLNSPQFSQIDLNGDGIKDLFIYERDVEDKNGIVLTFLNNGTMDSIDYIYAPEYQSKFPGVKNWVLLADYNCDGREDIFTWVFGGIAVYRNDYDSSNGLSFTLVSNSGNLWSPALSTDAFAGPTNLYSGPNDLPAIADIDDDGDLDIIGFCEACETAQYNRNYSMENYGTCDSLEYVIEANCWGFFSENELTNTIDLNIACKAGKTGGKQSTLHPGGSSMLALDMDGDQDKELILSDIANNEMELLINGGDLNNATIDSVIENFPSNTIPVNIITFPAAYYLDLDNDGLKDLVVAPNTTASVQNFTSAWFYKNVGLASAPVFDFVQDDFMQGEMIEVGEGAYPVFFDHNADGLMDLVIGNYGYWGLGGNYTGELSLYENVGTTTAPEFELITRDYQGLSSLSLNGLYPAFGDLDGDGDQDLLIGDYQGNVHYLENTAGSGNTAVFILSQPNYKGIDAGQFAAPQLVDVNRDGLLDLLIGERGGKIQYYENTGTSTLANFSNTPTNDFFGGIDIMPNCCTGYNVPFLTSIDTSGAYYLFVAGEDGSIHLYGNIEPDLTGNFGLADSMVGNIDLGLRTSISGADINSDGSLELVIGNYRGGIAIFTLEGSAILSVNDTRHIPFEIRIYPNPTSGIIVLESVSTNLPITSYRIIDLPGRSVMSETGLNRQSISIDLSTCKEGLYFIKVQARDGQFHTRKVILH
ncbi:MAG: T9SS type A sorting domain-containing protein [Flavobacteriales bacterium]|nr:T9SS type A sorting domain-containing protein [Flavobacteriales bacterium]